MSARSINFKESSSTKATSSNKSLTITLNDDPLSSLLDKITRDNLHSEYFPYDKNKGKEAW